ncbi:MAG: hypothetical protein EPO28_09840 [Saprospiraceae bacterium]|nr:MAG: hypothetical protein EPO28_09840 [Saprospiraceae bacterium]
MNGLPGIRFNKYANWFFPAIALAAIMVVNPFGNFPLNDDWQYAFPVKSWVEEGEMKFTGVFAPNILLQVAWGRLFCLLLGGFDFSWLRLSTLAAAAVAILVFAKLCKRAGHGQGTSHFAAGSLGFNPLFFSLAFTFMTDIPFLALCLLSLLSFHHYLENHKIAWLAAACLWAVAGFYIRQPGIILLPAYAVFLLPQERFTRLAWLKFFAVLALAALVFLSLEKWIKPALGIGKNYVPVSEIYLKAIVETPLLTVLEWLKKAVKTFVYFGFFSLPFLPFLWKKMKGHGLLSKKIWAFSLAANLLLLLYLVKIDKVFPFGGNILFNFGLGPELLVDVYTLGLPNTPKLPEWVLLLTNYFSQLSATFLLLLIIKGFAALSLPDRRFTCLLLLVNAIYLPLLSITSFFDRYLLLPIASFFWVLSLFTSPSGWRFPSLKWLPFCLISLFSLLATKDYLSWNRAKFQAFEYLLSQGASIHEMDAGYEYNGLYNYHSGGQTEKEGRSWWWVNDGHWLIAFGPAPGYEPVKEFPYFRWLFLKKDAILVLKKT